MSTIDGRPAQYGVTLKQLREVMEHRGREGIAKLEELGGVQELCKKLYTSPNEGTHKNSSLFSVFEYCLLINTVNINFRFAPF